MKSAGSSNQAANKRADMKFVMPIDKMNAGWWRKRRGSVLHVIRVWREETGHQGRHMQAQQGCNRQTGHSAHSALNRPNARIVRIKKNVGDEISRNQECRREHSGIDDEKEIPLKNGFDQEITQTGPAKNHFNQ